jgi:hypothetical protein
MERAWCDRGRKRPDCFVLSCNAERMPTNRKVCRHRSGDTTTVQDPLPLIRSRDPAASGDLVTNDIIVSDVICANQLQSGSSPEHLQ